jgi:hypothetical protein
VVDLDAVGDSVLWVVVMIDDRWSRGGGHVEGRIEVGGHDRVNIIFARAELLLAAYE